MLEERDRECFDQLNAAAVREDQSARAFVPARDLGKREDVEPPVQSLADGIAKGFLPG